METVLKLWEGVRTALNDFYEELDHGSHTTYDKDPRILVLAKMTGWIIFFGSILLIVLTILGAIWVTALFTFPKTTIVVSIFISMLIVFLWKFAGIEDEEKA